MLSATDLELRVGARLLLEPTSFSLGSGERVGLVGRNGAGKTTLMKVLAGEGAATAGTAVARGSVGYLPQDPRTGDLEILAMDRVLSARGIDDVRRRMRKAESEMESEDPAIRDRGVRNYAKYEERLHVLGGYSAEAEAATITANLGLENRILAQPLSTLSGGQRRRVELARILFSRADTLLLDEPTNHLDGDSITWLRTFLRSHQGGLIVISHDVDLVEHVVNKVFYLDANRSVIDVYNMGWKAYLEQRDADERRRRRERANAEKQASVLKEQAERFGAKATKARAAKQMQRRAEKLLDGAGQERAQDQVARLRLPAPAPCGRVPLTANGLTKNYGSLEVFAGVDLAIDRGARVVVLGLNGAGKTTLLRLLSGVETPEAGEVVPGHGLKLGYYAQEHETLDEESTVLGNMMSSAPDLPEVEARRTLGSFLFTGDDVHKPASVLSGGEKTRLALAALVVSSANVLLLDEPTNNLDPASREEILAALREYEGAIVLVTHEGAVEALRPERVIMLPDGTEDYWSPDLAELITLA
ncbi:ABC-F family ATP-binding cassette domain-containing protein [Spiractinospora alimapuensis]|uniref:ABC-F family ATP-binding cassette domain-containing protein n=1 Tax=Spiractinospora alimapuensis TaxID=2820884 RepID=UPI001F363B39|nr:ABC-F family ATP-binding cassette domain-containing protein [Spiractinospora alimapuensis]QVQ52439.1 ABC-F family ATP-binding cassette domain-containing protein [Spiractinospora alimapuensis]